MNDSLITKQPAELAELVQNIVEAHRADRGALLPILHSLHRELGSVPSEAVPLIARQLNLSRADVFGVVSFYRDFQDRTAGRQVRICRAEACQASGADALVSHAKETLGVGFGEATADGRVQLDDVFCLGNCALGPSVEVDGVLHGRVTPAAFDRIVSRGHRD